MMRFIVFIVLWCGFNNAFALEPNEVAAVVDPACIQDSSDPADLGFRNTSNSLMYAGQCIDGARFRPIVNFSNTGDKLVFDNYLHNNKYWRAEIPVTQVEKVYFQILRFPVLNVVQAAHTEIRFVFKKGFAAKLTRGTETSESGDILFSLEAGFPVGITYDFMTGAMPNYPRVVKVMSTFQKQSDNFERDLEQYDLSLTQDEMSQLLAHSMEYAATIGMSGFYNTARPNCTTEAFDMIDTLPRFAGKVTPFMTAASVTDPIAGPSIRALKKRGILKNRVQNYADEMNGVFKVLPTPKTSDTFESPLLPKVGGPVEWALNIQAPDTSDMSVDEKAAIEDLRNELAMSMPSLMQSYGAVMLMSPDDKKTQGLFLSTMKVFVQRLPSILRKMNDKLPEKPTPIRLYFVPDKKGPTSLPESFGKMGLPVELPFPVHQYQIAKDGKNEGDLLYAVTTGYRAADKKGVDKSQQAFLMGVALLVNVQKDHSKVTTQLMVGLNPMENKMSSDSAQVIIDKLFIPYTTWSGAEHPAMFITHVQDAMSDDVNSFIDIKFGRFTGVGKADSEYGLGSLLPQPSAGWMPTFQGRVKNWFTGNPVVDYFTGINFAVPKITMDLKTRAVTDMDLSISVFGVGGLKNDDAEKQFAAEANKAIQDALNKASDDPILQKLSPLLR